MSADATTAARSSVVHVLVAFVLMGSWAIYANRAHPMPTPLVAGAVQGTISALITFGLKRLVERLSFRFGGFASLVLPPLAAFSVSAALLTLLHGVAGTPEIVATIALPLTVSTSYAAIYSWGLWRAKGD